MGEGALLIPVSEPWFTEEDAQCMAACVREGWVSSAGPAVAEFENKWASYCGREHGVAVSSGTAALQLAVAALDLEPGDEVILPAFTIISCALAVIYAGAKPVLVDADPETWCMDAEAVEAKITPRTRAIMPVHIYGHPVEMEPLLDVARAHRLAVIEDAAEAHGAEYRSGGQWRRCGGFGEMSCFSFYANKLIATGEGGMVLTDDGGIATRLRSLRDLCFQPQRRFVHRELGWNYRLTNTQAALGVSQIGRVAELLARKRRMADLYRGFLGGVPGLTLPAEKPWARSMFWMFGIVLDSERGLTADDFACRLRARGIETRPFFTGMNRQPALLDRGLFVDEMYPVTDRLARFGLYLPSGLAITEAQIAEVSRKVREALG